jgi:tRNA G18 (ribose-2'-O)-methylase SpoU
VTADASLPAEATSGLGGSHAAIPVRDPSDPRIAEFLGLRDHELRRRRESPDGDLAGIFIAEGDLVVERAVRAGYRLRSVLVDATRTLPLPDAIGPDVVVYAASEEVVLHITGMAMHRGLIASLDRGPERTLAEVLAGATRAVVLENVNNPTNLGVIVRSAAGLGADALLLDPSCCDPLYRRASRVAMGEVFALPWARTERFPAGLDPVVAAGFSLLALTPDPGAEPIDGVVLGPQEKVALVLGAEGPGLTEETMARVGRRVRIPLHGGVDSLNVGAAAAIACYVLGRGRP